MYVGGPQREWQAANISCPRHNTPQKIYTVLTHGEWLPASQRKFSWLTRMRRCLEVMYRMKQNRLSAQNHNGLLSHVKYSFDEGPLVNVVNEYINRTELEELNLSGVVLSYGENTTNADRTEEKILYIFYKLGPYRHGNQLVSFRCLFFRNRMQASKCWIRQNILLHPFGTCMVTWRPLFVLVRR